MDIRIIQRSDILDLGACRLGSSTAYLVAEFSISIYVHTSLLSGFKEDNTFFLLLLFNSCFPLVHCSYNIRIILCRIFQIFKLYLRCTNNRIIIDNSRIIAIYQTIDILFGFYSVPRVNKNCLVPEKSSKIVHAVHNKLF